MTDNQKFVRDCIDLGYSATSGAIQTLIDEYYRIVHDTAIFINSRDYNRSSVKLDVSLSKDDLLNGIEQYRARASVYNPNARCTEELLRLLYTNWGFKSYMRFTPKSVAPKIETDRFRNFTYSLMGVTRKFWNIKTDSTGKVTTAFGRAGTLGGQQYKQCVNGVAGVQYIEKKIKEKLKKGYVEVT